MEYKKVLITKFGGPEAIKGGVSKFQNEYSPVQIQGNGKTLTF